MIAIGRDGHRGHPARGDVLVAVAEDVQHRGIGRLAGPDELPRPARMRPCAQRRPRPLGSERRVDRDLVRRIGALQVRFDLGCRIRPPPLVAADGRLGVLAGCHRVAVTLRVDDRIRLAGAGRSGPQRGDESDRGHREAEGGQSRRDEAGKPPSPHDTPPFPLLPDAGEVSPGRDCARHVSVGERSFTVTRDVPSLSREPSAVK